MIYVQIFNNNTTCELSELNGMTVWEGSRMQRTERALVLFVTCTFSFLCDTFVVMGTSHMNKDIWDTFNRVLKYEHNISTEYIFDRDL